MQDYHLLISKLDSFIRKFYANKLIRGAIFFLACVIAFYLIISIGEYYFYFPSWLRYILLFTLCIAGLGSLLIWIIKPLLQMQRLGKLISHTQAAEIIGNHFPNVKDKLLNILQLKELSVRNEQNDLVFASIEQKTKELKPVPFNAAINLSKNKKILPYFIFPAAIFVILVFSAPSIFTESANRLFQPEKNFEPAAPFQFQWVNKTKGIAQFADLEIKAKTIGKIIPESINIVLNGQNIAMQKQQDGSFIFPVHKIANNIKFQFEANGYKSENYEITVWKNPLIKEFSVHLNYPEYTGKKDELLNNIGDVVVPQGTKMEWKFKTENTDQLFFGLGKIPTNAIPANNNAFTFSKTFMQDTVYSIALQNKNVGLKEALEYRVSVIPDQYPSINVNQYNDSLTGEFVLFVGDAGDDYGIRSVNLQYIVTNQKGTKRNGNIPIKVVQSTYAQFEYFLDINELFLQAGDKLEYFFTACDNDAVNGSKCAKSATFTYNKATAAQVDSMLAQTQKEINKDLQNTGKQQDKIDKDIDKLKQNLLEKQTLDWQDQKKIQQLVQQNQNIQKQIENIQQKFQQNLKQAEDKNYSEDLKDKQKSVDKMLDDLKNNKLQDRMKKIEELMKLLNKDQLFEQLQQSKNENMQMEKDLDRMLELMKQLERDMRLEDLSKKASDLAKKQGDLKKENDANLKSNQDVKDKQDDLNKQMDDFKKELNELDKLNKETETPAKLDDVKDKQEDAKKDMQNSADQLSKNNKSKSSKSQGDAQKKLEDMAEQLGAMAGGDKDQTEIDIKATRQILSNLIRMSFGQEKLIDEVKKTNISEPAYVKKIQVQQKLKDDSKVIADSLFALSKRLFEISTFVNKEIAEVNSKMDASITYLEARNVGGALVDQQYVMTHTNNLALMLNELLDNLQKKQAQMQGQSGSCSKPGSTPGKKPGKGKGQGVGMQLSDIISQQQQLGSAMQQLANKMQNGKKPGDAKDGKDGKDGNKGEGKNKGKDGEGETPGGESQNMAQIAAQQAMLRKQLQDIHQQLQKEGRSLPELTKIQQDMDHIETELVNKRITEDLLSRQSLILNRLLKAKDAIREQDQGDQRESQNGKEISREIPQQLKDILKDKKSAVEYYKTVPASLQPYYKKLVEEYFEIIK